MVTLLSPDYLANVMMRAPGIKASRRFYEANWGLMLAEEAPDALYFRGTSAEPFIYGLREDPTFGLDAITFHVADPAKLEALHRQLSETGARLQGPLAAQTTPGGGIGFTALDPDHRRLRFVTGVTPRATSADEVARPRKITHVVLNSARGDDFVAFYTNCLGFRISDYSAEQMVFLRCASDHHAIALNRSPYPSVNHVAFEMPSIDSFMRGIGRMKTLGQAPAWGPGRHGPGNNPFAYFVSPSGFVIEFTTEVQQIDETHHEPQVWPRDIPEKLDVWMTAGPPTPAMRAVMQGRPDPGFPEG